MQLAAGFYRFRDRVCGVLHIHPPSGSYLDAVFLEDAQSCNFIRWTRLASPSPTTALSRHIDGVLEGVVSIREKEDPF